MLSEIILTLKNFLSSFIGAIIAFIFILIPTASFDAAKHIPYMEKDLGISIPAEYEVVEYSRDFLGFDATEEVTLKFDEANFEKLVTQTSSWEKEGDEYIFQATHEKYSVQGKLIPKEKVLKYKYLQL